MAMLVLLCYQKGDAQRRGEEEDHIHSHILRLCSKLSLDSGTLELWNSGTLVLAVSVSLILYVPVIEKAVAFEQGKVLKAQVPVDDTTRTTRTQHATTAR
jgi:hypothetical protein